MSAWTDMLSIPDWLKRAPGYQSGDHVARLADDPGRPDPVEVERQREERQKLRESAPGQAAERDFLDARAARERDLVHEQGGWVTPGEVLTQFPKLAQKLAEGMVEPTMMAFGPGDSAIKEKLFAESLRRLAEADLRNTR